MARIVCEPNALLSSRHFLPRSAVDHRVHELSRAVPVRRGSLRAEAVEEDQVREVRDGLRDPQSRLRRRSPSRPSANRPPRAATRPQHADARSRRTPPSSRRSRSSDTGPVHAAAASASASASRWPSSTAPTPAGLPHREAAHDHRPLRRRPHHQRHRSLPPARRDRSARRDRPARRPRSRRTARSSTARSITEPVELQDKSEFQIGGTTLMLIVTEERSS